MRKIILSLTMVVAATFGLASQVAQAQPFNKYSLWDPRTRTFRPWNPPTSILSRLHYQSASMAQQQARSLAKMKLEYQAYTKELLRPSRTYTKPELRALCLRQLTRSKIYLQLTLARLDLLTEKADDTAVTVEMLLTTGKVYPHKAKDTALLAESLTLEGDKLYVKSLLKSCKELLTTVTTDSSKVDLDETVWFSLRTELVAKQMIIRLHYLRQAQYRLKANLPKNKSK